ncbi:STAS domain-containing protein [Seonamhaeicola maritimus]|uniref:Anti-sigma factor antagonist n=1 Tax=Seonamhaeicola maritimus TaxID=2591822 RepID=A0A5C7GDW9_9FLAO|nr:STAS domain-containing protein [Seonamhaeicola maritimus]TXG34834.1 STAS domain-containing protein [Seonamhaeicola maritimus]
MALVIKIKEVNNVVLIALNGNLDTNTAPDAETEINNLLDKGTKKIIINLENTKYVSSAGLRIFLATAKKMTAASGAVKLCCANDVVQEILDISGFSSILDVKPTEKEALEDI